MMFGADPTQLPILGKAEMEAREQMYAQMAASGSFASWAMMAQDHMLYVQRPAQRVPTMTLAEWDTRRASYPNRTPPIPR